ncbi:hypothetical protein [Lentzea sp.]|uniref:hypothetical protein n=1 Tax=Lentzea sp. TaxID=56099 RepID=UPI002B601CFF|nr:hypothetical protein [Lentzea sp.]HUQ55117.1 hypothetical protein [Lentzea sp.]
MVARVALGLFGVLAVIGGAMLTAMVVNYFWGSGYVPELDEIGGWGTLAGAVALGIYVGGVVKAHPGYRVLGGVLAGVVGFGVTSNIATLVSLTAGRGGPRGNLEDGSLGFIWMVAGVFFVWVALKGRWPVSATRG